VALSNNTEGLKLYDVRSYDQGPFASWPVPSGEMLTFSTLKFSPDGARILLGTHNGVTYMLDAFAGQPVCSLSLSLSLSLACLTAFRSLRYERTACQVRGLSQRSWMSARRLVQSRCQVCDDRLGGRLDSRVGRQHAATPSDLERPRRAGVGRCLEPAYDHVRVGVHQCRLLAAGAEFGSESRGAGAATGRCSNDSSTRRRSDVERHYTIVVACSLCLCVRRAVLVGEYCSSCAKRPIAGYAIDSLLYDTHTHAQVSGSVTAASFVWGHLQT